MTEQDYRRRKVALLDDVILKLMPNGPSAEFLADLDVDHRTVIAKLAGVGYPSMETWEALVERFRSREAVANQTFMARLEAAMTGDQGDAPMFTPQLRPDVRVEPDDPFAGLPR